MDENSQLFLIISNILIILVIISFGYQLHNIDMVFNFIKNDSGKCDYINTNECMDLKEIYINSMRNVRYLFVSTIILLMISFNILIIKHSKYKHLRRYKNE